MLGGGTTRLVTFRLCTAPSGRLWASHPPQPELVCLSQAVTKDPEFYEGLRTTGLDPVSSISALALHKLGGAWMGHKQRTRKTGGGGRTGQLRAESFTLGVT